MAHVSIQSGDRNLGWWELQDPVTIGRHHDCQICLPDTLLSRTHVRFEQVGEDWAAVDLGSRNGTWCDGISLDRVLLLDGDVIRAGECSFTFHLGPPRGGQRFRGRMFNRPADPHEALNGTVADMPALRERQEDPRPVQNVPARMRPRPMPREVDLELRPSATGLLENLPPRPVRFPLRRPIMLELPSVEELLPSRISRPAIPPCPRPATAPAPVKTAPARPKARETSVDFWVFITVAVAMLSGACAAWRMLPRF
jgi:hypothetical protein